MNNSSAEKLETMPDHLIIDEFIFNNTLIVVLNNELLKIPDSLILAKINNANHLCALSQEEYNQAEKYYNNLYDLFQGE